MKKLALLSLITFTLFGCDQPIKSRYVNGGGSLGTGFDMGSGNNIGTNGDNGSGSTTSSSTTGQSTTGGQLGDGYENCTLNYQYYGGSFGYFGICQHATNERQFKAKFQTSNTQGICFVPVHFNDDGSSYKVGRAECSNAIASGSIYTIPTTKDVSASINGVMVIQYSSLNSYMQCMTYKANYLAANPACQYNSYCLQQVNQQANIICQNFKTNHSNNYKQVQF